MQVHQLMTRRPISIGRRTTVRSALQLIARNHLTQLPVVEADGRLVGVVGERELLDDALGRSLPHALLPTSPVGAAHHRYVEEVMVGAPVAVGPGTTVVDALDLMADDRVRCLPVVDDRDRLVGVLSRSDIAQAVGGRGPEAARARATRPTPAAAPVG